MDNDEIKLYLSTVDSKLESRLASLNKIGNEQLCETDYFLTELLFRIAKKGRRFPVNTLQETAIALELLFQAKNLGFLAHTSVSFSDELLLATDYLYAEAINQVIGLNEPEIIRLLAKAIADTAADRTLEEFELKDGKRLIEAAVELGLFLGDCAEAEKNNIRKTLNYISNSKKSEMLRIIDG